MDYCSFVFSQCQTRCFGKWGHRCRHFWITMGSYWRHTRPLETDEGCHHVLDPSCPDKTTHILPNFLNLNRHQISDELPFSFCTSQNVILRKMMTSMKPFLNNYGILHSVSSGQTTPLIFHQTSWSGSPTTIRWTTAYLPFHNANPGASENDAIDEGTSELLRSCTRSLIPDKPLIFHPVFSIRIAINHLMDYCLFAFSQYQTRYFGKWGHRCRHFWITMGSHWWHTLNTML